MLCVNVVPPTSFRQRPHVSFALRCQTLEKVDAICKARGQPFPRHLVIQSDNTVAQAKTSHANLFMAFLVAKHKFMSANLFHLMVGHTHEDVDQLFGVVLTLILRKQHFEEPGELMSYVLTSLSGHFAQRGEELSVQKLTAVRDFIEWLAPTGVTLHNAFSNRHGI
jgi:hypothetical protein